MVKNLINKPVYRYRGVNEAKYTMTTSLQRHCPPQMKGNQNDYMTMLLQKVKSSPKVVEFFKMSGIAINDISCLALMQHHGLPTPLLDFSTDIMIALSFASDGLDLSSGSEETDGYASLYVFDKQYEYEVGTPVQQVFESGLANGFQMWQDHMHQYPKDEVDASILFDINKFVKWDDINGIELCFIEYQPLAPGVVTLSGQNLDLSNPNLVKQKGCFLLNLYNETMPLEDNWNGRTTESRNNFWMSKGENLMQLPFSGVMTRDKMFCFDIKKDVLLEWANVNAVPLYDNRTTEILISFLFVQMVGVPATIIFCNLSEKLGYMKMFMASVVLWILLGVAFVIVSTTMQFYILAFFVGLVIGTTPAMARAILSSFLENRSDSAEIFGFNALTSRASSILGPLVFGAVSSITGSQRFGLFSLVLFFGSGLVILTFNKKKK